MKKVRDFFYKNEKIRNFVKGLDKRDEKFLFNFLRFTDFDPGDVVFKAGTMEKAIVLIASGEFIEFK